MKIRLNLTAALLAASLLVFCAAYRADAAPTLTVGGSLADLTLYQTEADFRNATGTLLLEDFSEAPVADNMIAICNEPIDGSSNQPGCFAPGDILPGISFQTENSLYQDCPACMVLFGKMTGFDNTTPMIGVYNPDLLEVSFSDRVDFIGMTVYGTPLISVYGTDGTLLGSAVNDISVSPISPLDFWGVVSKKPIGRITISGSMLDDIMFGAKFPWAMFLPAINSGSSKPVPQPGTVISAGQVWMDRNLGASQVAISFTDSEAYGDLYQWGRLADGHQNRTNPLPTTSTLSATDVPGHGSFITTSSSPYDWRSPQNANLWQGVSGINNPCPAGFRLPTLTELDTERLSWSTLDYNGAFASPLKLVPAGFRNVYDGTLSYAGSFGYYWSSTVDDSYSRYLNFSSGDAYIDMTYRAFGFSVRCLRD